MMLDVAIPAGMQGFMAGIAANLDLGRQQLLRHLQGLTPEQLDAVPQGLTNSIATLVVHVCATEVHFAFSLRGLQVPDGLKPMYLIGQHDGRLPVPAGETVESLTETLSASRALLVETLVALGDADLEEALPFGPERTATRRWFLSLLPYHQTSHTGQLQMVKKLVVQIQ